MSAQPRATRQKIRLIVEYDGASFYGWQRQERLPSVQQALEEALFKITRETPYALDMRCAGRTDAGVHAQAQVVTFVTEHRAEPRRFATALNHYLPKTVQVHASQSCAPDFSARHAAVHKSYQYQIYMGPHPAPLLAQRAWHIKRRLDLEAMKNAAQDLLGEHDFESLRSVHCEAAHARRCVIGIAIGCVPRPPKGQLVTVTVKANAFCRHMCRIIVGTLVEVGAHKRAADSMPALLLAKDRRRGGMTAPPHGLTLVDVHYPSDGLADEHDPKPEA